MSPPTAERVAQVGDSDIGREFFNIAALSAVAVFALNNFWWKAHFHNWLTGKLSDFAFCFFFPLYVSVLLRLALAVERKRSVFLGACLTAIGFATVKTWP